MQERRILLSEEDLEAIDLGLPSGVKWAKSNLQKTSDSTAALCPNETDYGEFWSWANVGLTYYTGWMWSSGAAMTQAMYNSTTGKSQKGSILRTDASHDVAYKYLGTPWRLPTNTEFSELINNTDSELTTINGVKGRKFMKKTDHSIYVFFPASGLCNENNIGGRGSSGYYWSSTSPWNDSSSGYVLQFYSSIVKTNTEARHCGCTVRPVQ